MNEYLVPSHFVLGLLITVAVCFCCSGMRRGPSGVNSLLVGCRSVCAEPWSLFATRPGRGEGFLSVFPGSRRLAGRLSGSSRIVKKDSELIKQCGSERAKLDIAREILFMATSEKTAGATTELRVKGGSREKESCEARRNQGEEKEEDEEDNRS